METVKKWFTSLVDDTVDRYSAEMEFIEAHPFIGWLFFDLKWYAVIMFWAMVFVAIKKGKVWDLVDPE